MNILALHPWIYDFAAFDYWLKPYGFLTLLTYLKNKGHSIQYIDCLDKYSSKQKYGTGKYYFEEIQKPDALKSIPRKYKRYGIKESELILQLENKNPDIILISSSMTYWYPSIIDLVNILKSKFQNIPIYLGGTYASLCMNHAKENILCDGIFDNSTQEIERFFETINVPFDYDEFFCTLPDYNFFYDDLRYIVFRTSWGCPYSCSFCAIDTLSPNYYKIKNTDSIIEWVSKYSSQGIMDFVFYDDALFYEKKYILDFLNKINDLKLNIRFHTPNALHLKFLDEELAYLMKSLNFINPHFGLETIKPDILGTWGKKANDEDLRNASKLLQNAGFKEGEYNVYLIFGYPGQDLEDIKNDVAKLNSYGAKVSLSEFSPVPKTELYDHFSNKLDDPLFHNNSVFTFFTQKNLNEIWKIKNQIVTMQKQHFSV